MAYAFINSVQTPGALAGSTSAAIDTTGATLLVMTTGHQSGNTLVVSDSYGNTWTSLTASSGGTDPVSDIYYVNNPTVGSGHTFTTSGGAFIFAVAQTYAFSGNDTSSPFDVENTNFVPYFTSTPDIQTGSVSPTNDNSLIVAAVGTNTGTTPFTIDSSFTGVLAQALVGSQNVGAGGAYLIQGSKAAVNPTWTITSGSGNLSAAIAVFKAPTTPPVFRPGQYDDQLSLTQAGWFDPLL